MLRLASDGRGCTRPWKRSTGNYTNNPRLQPTGTESAKAEALELSVFSRQLSVIWNMYPF